MDEWPSGVYSSYTFTGTRPGGAIAAAGAGMQFLGESGYRQAADSSMKATEAITSGLARIPSVRVFSNPDLWAFAFGSDEVDIHGVAALMGKRGWMCGPTIWPRGIHMICTPVHEPIAAEYVAAIAECVEQVRSGDATTAQRAAYN